MHPTHLVYLAVDNVQVGLLVLIRGVPSAQAGNDLASKVTIDRFMEGVVVTVVVVVVVVEVVVVVVEVVVMAVGERRISNRNTTATATATTTTHR